MNMKKALIVGRYQTYQLLPEQIAMISQTIEAHAETILVLGNALVKGTIVNPLDYRARKAMFAEHFPKLKVLYLTDNPNDDVAWSKALDEIIQNHLVFGEDTTPKVTIYGGQDSVVAKYKGKFATQSFEASTFISGDELRRRAMTYPVTEAYRAGMIAAQGFRYPTSYQAVDIAIIDKNRILLGRKPNETQLRFIGGFSDPNSPSLEADARREVQEETGVEVDDITYIGSTLVDLDPRYKLEVDKIKTALFVAKYVFGRPTAKDDICELRWVPLSDLTADILVPTHHILLDIYNKHIVNLVFS